MNLKRIFNKVFKILKIIFYLPFMVIAILLSFCVRLFAYIFKYNLTVVIRQKDHQQIIPFFPAANRR